jgi:hypothetical protein
LTRRWRGRGPAVFIAQPRQPDGHVCSFALVTGRSCALAAGITWTSRTASAQWAGRQGHTTVVDAAGAIYVIGGYDGSTRYRDVWASTDGGADWTKSGVAGVTGWVLQGYYEGTGGVMAGFWRDPQWSTKVFEDCTKWMPRVLEGYSRSSLGCTKGALCVRVCVCMCMCVCVRACVRVGEVSIQTADGPRWFGSLLGHCCGLVWLFCSAHATAATTDGVNGEERRKNRYGLASGPKTTSHG